MGAFWSFRFWDWRWYQKAADDVNSWDYTDDQKAFIENTLSVLPKRVKTKLLSLVRYIYEYCLRKYGAKWVKETIAKIIKFLTMTIEGLIKKDD